MFNYNKAGIALPHVRVFNSKEPSPLTVYNMSGEASPVAIRGLVQKVCSGHTWPVGKTVFRKAERSKGWSYLYGLRTTICRGGGSSVAGCPLVVRLLPYHA